MNDLVMERKDEVAAYINSNPGRDFTRDGLMHRFGISDYYLSRMLGILVGEGKIKRRRTKDRYFWYVPDTENRIAPPAYRPPMNRPLNPDYLASKREALRRVRERELVPR